MKDTVKKYLRDGRAPIPLKESTSRVMSANKGKDTKPEVLLRRALWESGVRGYRKHKKNVPGRPDISFSTKKVAVFVNGCFWHRCPYCKPSTPKSNQKFWATKFQNNIERDKRKLKELQSLGWKTLTIWECQLRQKRELQVNRVKRLLDQRR